MDNQIQGPQFIQYFQPVLDALDELGGSGRPTEIIELIAKKLNLSEEEQSAQISSGQSRFGNRVGWARFYLAKAGIIDSSTKGVWSLTEVGRKTRLSHSEALDLFKGIHQQFSIDKKKKKGKGPLEEGGGIEEFGESEADYRVLFMKKLMELPSNGFERLCQRLLRESGFESVTVTGKSSDGGLDGIGILEVNPFVSFKVLFQCKRYIGSVTPSQVRDFRGAMSGRADKGIILTTGTFTSEAKREAIRDGVPAIELVNGEKLIDLFETLELGLKHKKAFDIDERFFEDFQ